MAKKQKKKAKARKATARKATARKVTPRKRTARKVTPRKPTGSRLEAAKDRLQNTFVVAAGKRLNHEAETYGRDRFHVKVQQIATGNHPRAEMAIAVECARQAGALASQMSGGSSTISRQVFIDACALVRQSQSRDGGQAGPLCS